MTTKVPNTITQIVKNEKPAGSQCLAGLIGSTGRRRPVQVFWGSRAERKIFRQIVSGAVHTIMGTENAKVLVALGEAVSNAFAQGKTVRVKLNTIGIRIIVRVRDDGPGFPGNEAVEKINAVGVKDFFRAGLGEERGRGLPIMMSFMDQVIYNRRGNEVLMLKTI